MGPLLIVERLHVVLPGRLLVGLELAAHKLTGLLHALDPRGDNPAVKVDQLHDIPIRGNAVHKSEVAVIEELLFGPRHHDIVPVEVVMDKSIRPLRIGQRHHNLGHPRCVLLGLRVLLNQVVECSLELLHDRRDHGDIVKRRPGKRLAFLVTLEGGFISLLFILAIAGLDLVLVLIVRGGIVLEQTALLAFGLRLMGPG